MKILYLDCGMGASGDMLMAALLELLPNPDEFIEEVNELGLKGVYFKKEVSVKCGISGTHISVMVNGLEEESHDHHHGDRGERNHGHHHGDRGEHSYAHSHSSLHDIEHIVRGQLNLSEKVKNDVMAVYQLIAEAESKVHGVPVTQIHFHEVGTLDAIADITSVCMLMERLSPCRVIVSPIHTGSGQVSCAHGILPVPAPATAHILQDIPIYSKGIRGELCTPTGAALLKYFASQFGDMPIMKIQNIGYGMGKKDFEAANCVRAMLGDASEDGDTVVEFSCNLDDMTAEAIGFAMEELLAAGALEVYTIAVGMKKSRPGTLLCVMCHEDDRDKMIKLIFQHTTTIGIREQSSRRYTMSRSIETMNTPLGKIRRKISRGYGTEREKYEYEDIAQLARKEGISTEEAVHLIEKIRLNT